MLSSKQADRLYHEYAFENKVHYTTMCEVGPGYREQLSPRGK